MIIEITINANYDTIRIKTQHFNKECKLKHSNQVMKLFQDIFEEISTIHDSIVIRLNYIDEDTNTNKGEWEL